jgi:tRNA(fMet)-specific endonuclease VapC
VSWLLDTDSCSFTIRGQHGLRLAVEAHPLARLYVSAITVGEAWAGALRSPHRDRLIALWSVFLEPFAGRILPFDEEAAHEYGAIRADLEARGDMIGDRDCMLAAIARSRRLKVVTRNQRDFRRVAGLRVVDWSQR